MWTKPPAAPSPAEIPAAFVSAAEAFTKHIEAVGASERTAFVRGCVARIARVLAEAVDLPAAGDDAHEVEFVTTERFEEINRALKAKLGGADFYKMALDPYEIAAEPAMGCLSDDLADLWRALKNGSEALNQGYAEKALGHWQVSFGSQWGEIAAQVLRPLMSLSVR